MIKKTHELEPGDILPGKEGRLEIVERTPVLASARGPLGLYKLPGTIGLDGQEVGGLYNLCCSGSRKWKVEDCTEEVMP